TGDHDLLGRRRAESRLCAARSPARAARHDARARPAAHRRAPANRAGPTESHAADPAGRHPARGQWRREHVHYQVPCHARERRQHRARRQHTPGRSRCGRKAVHRAALARRRSFAMTITDALNIQLARLRTRFSRTPLPRFFAWWGRELVACLPARWQALLAERSDALLLENQARELVLWRQSGERCRELGRIALDDTADGQRAAYLRLRAELEDPNLPQYYCIRPERTLRRSISLPAAAEDNLRQVLSFEMDRQTPFKADQVYFDYRLGARSAAD